MLDEVLITEKPVSAKDRLGVTVHEMRPGGLVTLYEEYSVRIEAGYNLFEWDQLTPYERAAEVAHFRIRQALEYQKAKKSEQQMKASSER